ncbi:MAG: hypothetical protein PHC62_01290 [Candidatus Izemoplasmatales bacterium]|jgi:hypothetical protein|nr:hypothetical protein [Candidatus Izemoplasmatales bacterium]
MYTVMKDSLFEPKKIPNHRNKSIWFLAFYFLVLSSVMSIGSIIYLVRYADNSVITSESTGCVIANSSVECSGTSHNASTLYTIYDNSLYFLSETESVDSIVGIEKVAYIFQGSDILIYANSKIIIQTNISSVINQYGNFDEMIQGFQTTFLVSLIFFNILVNFITLLLFSLISMITFLDIKKFIPFKKLYIMVAFSMTPIAILMTFSGLVQIGQFIFILLLLIGYRSLFVLRKELAIEVYQNIMRSPVSKGPDSEELLDIKENEESEDQKEETDKD